MCGIFGLVKFDDQPVDETSLATLDHCMIHRGPDDNGVLRHGGVAIGMRRLSIIDLAGGHQPIANEDESIHLVLNGEIYNYRELRTQLESRGHRFRTQSDVEVLLHLYEEQGTESIHQLNGMFAFALYDRRKGLVWLARDRLGIKPLFYHNSNGQFTFSSELNGLAQISRAPISPDALVAYLGYSYFPAPLTPYEGIQRLMPGEEMIVCRGVVKQRQYWSLAGTPPADFSPKEAKEKLSAILEEAVAMQLVSDVPLGVFLSGGVDSSAIAALATRHMKGEPLRTFTIDFVDKAGSDTRFAELVSRTIGSHQIVIKVTAHEQQATFDELIPLMDEPMADTAIVPTYIVSRHARDCGVKVLLSGAGGDELFGGYPRHFAGITGSATWLANLPQPLRAASATILGLRNAGWGIRFSQPARDFAVQISGVNLAYLSQALILPGLYQDLLHSIDHEFQTAGKKGIYPRMALDVRNYLPNNVLSLTDKGTMMASVEGRVPLLDHRLAELAFSIPESINVKGGAAKALFRSTLEGLVPDAVLHRRKEGFNAPILPWVEAHVRQIEEELVHQVAPELSALIRTTVTARWVRSPKLRQQAASSLYSLYVLNRWLRTHNRK